MSSYDLGPFSLIARLAGVAGLDTSAGLARCAGSAEVYAMLLARFVGAYGAGVRDLASFESSQAVSGSLRTLREACLDVGALTLVERIDALQQRLFTGCDRRLLTNWAYAIHARVVALCAGLQSHLQRLD